MSEYKVSYHMRAKTLFGPSGDDIEIVEADTGQAAIDMVRRKFRIMAGIHEDDIELTIQDVVKL